MRRSELDSTSLDLLLDTITNTFGGILFVTILVVLLLRMGGSTAQSRLASTDDMQVRELQSTLLERQSELHSLRQIADSQQRTLARLSQGDTKKLYARLATLRLRISELTTVKSGLLARIDQMTTEMRGVKASVVRLSASIEEEKVRHLELARALASETQVRTRTAELPSVRSTSKREFPLIVRFGRLYAPYSVDSISGERLRQLEDFIVLGEDDEEVLVTPKPYRGTSLDESAGCKAALGRLLDSVDKESFYVAIAVWDDSFAEFSVLKNVLVGQEIEYRLLPTISGEIIHEGPTDGAYVQ